MTTHIDGCHRAKDCPACQRILEAEARVQAEAAVVLDLPDQLVWALAELRRAMRGGR